MKFGLSESEYQFILKNVVKPLQAKGAKIWCFGSRARGDHSKFSDLDLMLESSSDLSNEIGKISEKIIESNFPYKLDIVQEKNFADSYKENFKKDKILF